MNPLSSADVATASETTRRPSPEQARPPTEDPGRRGAPPGRGTAEAAEAEATRGHRRGTGPPTRPPRPAEPEPDRAGGPTSPASEDLLRVGLLESMKQALGDAVVGAHIVDGTDLWVRVDRRGLAGRGRPRPGTRSAALLLLPVGHRLAALALRPQRGRRPVRPAEAGPATPSHRPRASPAARPASRCFARVSNARAGLGLTLKADVPDDELGDRHWIVPSTPAPTGTSGRPGRCSASPSWATRTSCTSTCRATFEGHPLRKDFPLLAREVKPWPGIVDVEPHARRGRRAESRRGRRDGDRGGDRMTAHRAPAARLHRRPGGRRPGQRRDRDRGHDPQHRPPAPGHPRHAAHRRQARRRAGRRLPSRSWATCTAATRS